MKIAVLTRKPQEGKNNWVVVGQDKNWRGVAWGSGRTTVKGLKYEEVANTFDEFVANRTGNGYVVQAELTINIPARVIRKFLIKIAPYIVKIASRFLKE